MTESILNQALLPPRLDFQLGPCFHGPDPLTGGPANPARSPEEITASYRTLLFLRSSVRNAEARHKADWSGALAATCPRLVLWAFLLSTRNDRRPAAYTLQWILRAPPTWLILSSKGACCLRRTK